MSTISKGEIKEYMRKWGEGKWKEEMESKTSIKIYRKYKMHIEEDQIYDNTEALTILYQARANTLQLSDRNRFGKESTACKCKLCISEIEDLEHFLLHCQTLNNVRQEINILQQPYIEDHDNIIMDFLFDQEAVAQPGGVREVSWPPPPEMSRGARSDMNFCFFVICLL